MNNVVEFGDIEPDDVWDDDPTIDPFQVALRLHELRFEIDALAGADTPRWRDLDPLERQLAESIGAEIVAFVAVREPDNPALTARRIHDVRVWLSAGVVRDWDELAPDEQQIAIDLVDLILDWLEGEGDR